ncbi:MAG: lipid IV(A) 3-deoxy-D-manno-octulosonic acid transferase [Steroidobacteraceae bacterium]|nr:lipid IV(A) 3-deoxy-D-manno-octulosonic acid transferase [Steroidobacteraceae bacterium]
MRLLYIVVAYLLAPVAAGIMLARGLRDRSYWRDFMQRFGFGRYLSGERSVWVHAVSVGEVQAAAPLVESLLRQYPSLPLVLTTVTPTGAGRARALFGDRVHVRYIPYDLPGSVNRFFQRIRPRLVIILETEIWPNLYHACGKLDVPLVLASARISPKSVGRYRLLTGLFRETLSHGISIAAQGPADAERFRSIGANPARTHVVGNIKFDFALPPDIDARGRNARELLGRGRPVWVAGSTHQGEEEQVLAAQRRVLAAHPDALLVLVPRHPQRFAEVAALLERSDIPYVTRSSGLPVPAGSSVFLLDTLGELLSYYAASDVAFVAGSLVPIGGHNLLEPAALGKATLTGPHNFNSEDIAKLLLERGAVELVTDAIALAASVVRLLSDADERQRRGAFGRAVVAENRGAVARLLPLLAPLITAGD